MERSVPWWRRALEFALGGIRSGWGLFRRNGTKEAGADAIREAEIAAGRIEDALRRIEEPQRRPEERKIDEPREEIQMKHTSPQNEEVAAVVELTAQVEQAAEAVQAAGGGAAEKVRPEPTPAAGAESVPVAAEREDQVLEGREGRKDDLFAAEEQAEEDSEDQSVEFAAAVNQDPVPENPAGQAVEITASEELSGQQGAEIEAAAEPVAAQKAEVEAAPEPRAEAVPSQEAAKEVKPQEPAPQEIAPKLPFAPRPKHERTTPEKVAAALKARGEDAEQSPFSVIVSQVYDGPLDLLLDLIRKQDIDIYDIPIAKITGQFLAYVDRLKASDMDVAGEFIYTAALLIHIKSKMLLPRSPGGPEDAAEDPRRELVERLLEHERFKNAAQMLKEKQMLEAATWTNPGAREFREEEGAEAGVGPEIAADTTDLVRVFSNILERARNRPVIDVEEDTVTVSQMIQFLARRLTMEDKPVALCRLLSHTRSERALIAMFLALLEMVRLQAILLRQDRHFSEIFIKKHTGFEAAMNQGLADARDDWR